MYTRSKSILVSNNISPEKFIESIDDHNDIANSTLLHLIDTEDHRNIYEITKYECRIDLIAKEIYGSEKYSWLLLYMNRKSINELVRGVKLEYIPITRLEVLLTSI